MDNTYEEKRKPKIGLIIGAIIGLLLILGILYLVFFEGAFPWGSSIKAHTLASLNLRQGPGISYPTTGGVPADTEVTVIGRNEDGSWLLIKTDSGNVWMTGSPEFVEIDAASLRKLPVVEAPPLAYNASNVHVDQVMNQIPLVVHHNDHFTCASHAGLNNLLTASVADGNVIGPHSGDFALINQGGGVLFEYSQGNLRLIRDNPIARFDGDEKYLPLDVALRMFESGEVVWTGYFGEWPARGVPGCDESSKPE